MNLAALSVQRKKKPKTPRHNMLLGLDDSEQRPRTNTNQVTTLKTMSTGGPSPAKTTCNPIICLGESHTCWLNGEWVKRVCVFLWLWASTFSIYYKLIRPKGSNRSCCLTACLFLFWALQGKTAAHLITAIWCRNSCLPPVSITPAVCHW